MEVDAPKGIWQSGNKKREKHQKGKKQEIGDNFLNHFLFIIPHENMSVYISENGQAPELAQDDWLQSLLAEEMNVTVVVNHLLLLRLHWDMCLEKNTQNTFIVTFCS